MILLSRAMTDSGLSLLLFEPLPNPTGILTECSGTVNVSKALNLEFDCETLKDAPYLVPS